MIQKLFDAGAARFRINMSHASHDTSGLLIKRIRAGEERCGRPIGILADLQGPKLRVGKFAAGKVALTPGQTVTLDNREEPGDENRVFLPHPEILQSVKAGHRLLIDDGKLMLRAETVDGTKIVCTVVRSEEHTSELQSLMRISYAVFCLKKKINTSTKKLTDKEKSIVMYTHNR